MIRRTAAGLALLLCCSILFHGSLAAQEAPQPAAGQEAEEPPQQVVKILPLAKASKGTVWFSSVPGNAEILLAPAPEGTDLNKLAPKPQGRTPRLLELAPGRYVVDIVFTATKAQPARYSYLKKLCPELSAFKTVQKVAHDGAVNIGFSGACISDDLGPELVITARYLLEKQADKPAVLVALLRGNDTPYAALKPLLPARTQFVFEDAIIQDLLSKPPHSEKMTPQEMTDFLAILHRAGKAGVRGKSYAIGFQDEYTLFVTVPTY